MNEDAVRALLDQLGITLPPDGAARIAAEVAALGTRLATTPRPAFEDEPTSFQVRARQGDRS